MTKKELQEQINKLQEQLSAMPEDEAEQYYYLMLDGAIAVIPIGDIFNTLLGDNADGLDEKHGLGKYKTREHAEMARACLIGLLRILKQLDGAEQTDATQYSIYLYLREQGKEIIKQIEDGTYNG